MVKNVFIEYYIVYDVWTYEECMALTMTVSLKKIYIGALYTVRLVTCTVMKSDKSSSSNIIFL